MNTTLSATLAVTAMFGLPIIAMAKPNSKANLHQIDQSRIKAQIQFVDTGSTLKFNGTATGLDPTKTYVSLVYDDDSIPGGPRACLPTDNSLSFAQMVLGVWRVNPDGTGTLSGTNRGTSYVPLTSIGTTSVRQDTQPTQPLPTVADPNRFVLQACGRI